MPPSGESAGLFLTGLSVNLSKPFATSLITIQSSDALNFLNTESKACLFKKAEGGCSALYLRYYYNSVYDKCKRFLWTGCIGNGNRFFDYNSCNAACGGYIRTQICQFSCVVEFDFVLYYDPAKDECHPFIYKGEGGNANRFENERMGLSRLPQPVSDSDPLSGCNGKYLRYYYNSVYDKCKKFLWTGCIGNGNRFFDYNSCNATCAGIHGKHNSILHVHSC
uniref:BPTI/Kunitz inhibitor domain-containing protein n=1 Tax=Echeneis naucrates TaxID=173247 RepID=A0A665W8S5_ECHNA